VLTLGQAVAQQGVQGASIETPFKSLTNLGFTLRRGQSSLVVAAPGVGKSVLALDLVMRLHQRNLRSLYISADTDSFTMGMRAIAKMTGQAQSVIERNMKDAAMSADYMATLDKLWNVRFSFDCASMEDVRDEVFAYATSHGAFAPLLVVDNLVNLIDGDDEYRAMRAAVSAFDRLAHNTGAHVMVLHHANGKYDDGDQPIPLSGIENKVSKYAAQVITLNRQGEYLRVNVVKNRSGKVDAKAHDVFTLLRADLSTQQISDLG
jgi:RecA-family ATPase